MDKGAGLMYSSATYGVLMTWFKKQVRSGTGRFDQGIGRLNHQPIDPSVYGSMQTETNRRARNRAVAVDHAASM